MCTQSDVDDTIVRLLGLRQCLSILYRLLRLEHPVVVVQRGYFAFQIRLHR